MSDWGPAGERTWGQLFGAPGRRTWADYGSEVDYTQAPTVAELTMAAYDRLPLYIRLADAAQVPVAFPLLRYLATFFNQLDALSVLVGRMDWSPLDEGGADGETSDLVDPATADAGWLDWLGQLVGVSFGAELADAKRTAIAGASDRWAAAGTLAGIVEAVQAVLVGSERVLVTRNAGGPNRLTLTVYDAECPDPVAAEASATDPAVKPAGLQVTLNVVAGGPWSEVTATYATWADVIAAHPTWEHLASWVPPA